MFVVKVLLLDLWRVINSKGGTEKVFFSMANALADRGYDITAVGLDNTVGKPGFNVNDNVNFVNVGIGYEEKRNLAFRIRRAICGSWEKRHEYEEKAFDYVKANRLKPVIDSFQPDIIVSYNAEATRILIKNLQVNIPVVTMFHYDPDTILSSATNATKEALEKCACIQVLLPSFVNITKKYLKHENVVCIPNIVPQYNLRKDKSRENIIINVARIDGVQKRQHLLIEAFAKIKDKYPDWRVEIWGETGYDDKYYNKCKKLLIDTQTNKQILFCGTCDNVLKKLETAKIFAFPSAYEGFGLALTEAMSVELPAIGYKNCPAVNELIKDGENGFLCEEGVDAFAQALEKLMSDEKLRKKMGKAAKEDMKQYAPDRVWDTWEKLMEKILNEKH